PTSTLFPYTTLFRSSPAHTRANERGRQDLTDVALFDEVPHVRHRRRRARLQTSHREETPLRRQCRQDLRFRQTIAQWPFAVHGRSEEHTSELQSPYD